MSVTLRAKVRPFSFDFFFFPLLFAKSLECVYAYVYAAALPRLMR